MAQFSETARNRCLHIFPNNGIQALEDLIMLKKKKGEKKEKEPQPLEPGIPWKGCVSILPRTLADSGNTGIFLSSSLIS